MLWLACHNPDINWKTGEVKITRYLDEYGKQQRPKQRKLEQEKQKKRSKRRRRRKRKIKLKDQYI